jgi:hypothetical protein
VLKGMLSDAKAALAKALISDEEPDRFRAPITEPARCIPPTPDALTISDPSAPVLLQRKDASGWLAAYSVTAT